MTPIFQLPLMTPLPPFPLPIGQGFNSPVPWYRFWFRFTFKPQRAWAKPLDYWDHVDASSYLWFV